MLSQPVKEVVEEKVKEVEVCHDPLSTCVHNCSMPRHLSVLAYIQLSTVLYLTAAKVEKAAAREEQ